MGNPLNPVTLCYLDAQGNPVPVDATHPLAVIIGSSVTGAVKLQDGATTQLATIDVHGSVQFLAMDSTGTALDFTSPAATKGSLIVVTDLTGAVINTVSSGDNVIVAAVAAQTTRVHRMRLHAAGALTVTVKRGLTTLEKIIFAAAGDYILPFTERPYWTTAANETFVLSLGGAVQLDGRIEYVTGA